MNLYEKWPKLYSRALLKAVDLEFISGVEFLLKNERQRNVLSLKLKLIIDFYYERVPSDSAGAKD